MSWHLFSSPRSPFVRNVMVAAHELGLDDKIHRQDVVTNPMVPAPEVLTANPMGMIPTLRVDETDMFDSAVIMEFFNEQANGTLFPQGSQRWEFKTRHAMADAAMDKAVRILDEQFRIQNEDTQAHRVGYVQAITRTIAWFEPKLNDNRFDAADIAFAVLLAYIDMRFPEFLWRDKAPRATQWLGLVSKRPSMIATEFATTANV